MPSSVVEALLDAIDDGTDPDNGMTTAIAPATGSQTIIHIISNFWNRFMFVMDKDNADWFIPLAGVRTLFFQN